MKERFINTLAPDGRQRRNSMNVDHVAAPRPSGIEKQAIRLGTFDAMRGLAAIAVLLYHAKPDYAPAGYLAVDVFFLLSGFVIARTYDSRFAAGLSLTRFAVLRLIRFYPLYLLGLVIGILRCVGQIALDRPDRMTSADAWISAVFGLLFLPSPATPHLSPLNHPGWSLFFEMAVNLVYAAGVWKASLRSLGVVTLACGMAFVALSLGQGSIGMGFSWATLLGGATRVGFAFGLGAIIARLHPDQVSSSWRAIIVPVVLVFMLVLPIAPAHRVIHELLVAGVAAPILLWLGATYNPPEPLRGISSVLGDLSYAVYAIHFPLMWMFGYAARKLGWVDSVWVPACVVLILVLAWVSDRAWDRPVRAWLGRLLSDRSSARPSSATSNA